MRQQQRQVISSDVAFSVDPDLFAKNADAARATKASLIVGFFAKAASAHKDRLIQVMRQVQHLIGRMQLNSTYLTIELLAIGDLTVGQPHSWLRLEASNSRTLVHLAPETSCIEGSGIGIEGCSARNYVLIAADYLACAIPHFAFNHELIIAL